MNISRTNIVLAVLLLAVVVLPALLQVDYSRPNYEIALPADMGRSPAYHAFAPNTNFADGRTLQRPVSGTIARGETLLYFQATPEDAIRAGEEIQNPYSLPVNESETASDESTVPVENGPTDSPQVDTDDARESGAGPPTDPSEEPDGTDEVVETEAEKQAAREAETRERLQASVQRGGDVFRVFCIACHGPSGAGDGAVPQRGFPPPPSMMTGKSMQMKDGQLFHIITYGQGSMASYAAQLPPDRRWDVINYVRSLQKKAGTTAAPAVTGDSAPSDGPVGEDDPVDEDAEAPSDSNVDSESTTTQPDLLEPAGEKGTQDAD